MYVDYGYIPLIESLFRCTYTKVHLQCTTITFIASALKGQREGLKIWGFNNWSRLPRYTDKFTSLCIYLKHQTEVPYSPIFQWLFHGIKVIPWIFLFSSKQNCWIQIKYFFSRNLSKKNPEIFLFVFSLESLSQNRLWIVSSTF